MATKKTATKRAATKSDKTTALRSAALPQKHLVDVGARFGLVPLVDHASVVVAKVTDQNADPDAPEHFSDYGFGAPWVASIQALLAKLDVTNDAKSTAAAAALPTASALQSAFTAVKELRRQGVTAISADPTRPSSLHALGTGSSVPATRRALAKVAQAIPLTAVTPVGTGREFRAKAQTALKALDAAEKAHRSALAKLSPAAVRVHTNKGILQQELKSAARVARTVSPSDANLYAVDAHTRIHERSRKRPQKTNGATASTATGTAAPTSGAAASASAKS